jgi:hypothetical protein
MGLAVLLAFASMLVLAAAQEGGTPQGRPAAKARQAAAAAQAAQQGGGSAAPATQAATPAPGGNQVLEEVRKQEEASSSDKGLTYDPGDRRDPFVSPAEAAKIEDTSQCQGEGTECWLISEINLIGIMARRAGAVALVTGPEAYGGTLRSGDKLYDGEVLSIDAGTGTVTFRQKVNDPSRIKPYRDIEKKLNTTKEGGV